MKTYANWKGNLNEYLQVGDIVDEEFVEYFANVLPPAAFNSRLIQIGEPYSHQPDGDKYKPTYPTLENTAEGWRFCGYCFRGDTTIPEDNRRII